MKTTIPENTLVALSESPEAFKRGQYRIVPAHEAVVSIFDRSFHFGDSIYEVARTYNGIPFGMNEHMARMKASLGLAGFEEMPDFNTLQNMIGSTAKQWCKTYGNHDLYIRWMVSRGVGDLNISRSSSSTPWGFVFIKALQAPTTEDFNKGYHFAIVDRLRNHPRAVDPHMKSGNYINNILALAEAQKKGAQDGIMLDHDGFITEGTTNNVYMVKNNCVYTAASDAAILEGITRRYVIQAAKELGITFKEAQITAAEFRTADEAFLSSSIKEIMPITQIDGVAVGQNAQPGPITKRLAQKLSSIILSHTKTRPNETLFS